MKQIKITKTSIYPQGKSLIHRSIGEILSVPKDISVAIANNLVGRKYAEIVKKEEVTIEAPVLPEIEKKIIEPKEKKIIKKKAKKATKK